MSYAYVTIYAHVEFTIIILKWYDPRGPTASNSRPTRPDPTHATRGSTRPMHISGRKLLWKCYECLTFRHHQLFGYGFRLCIWESATFEHFQSVLPLTIKSVNDAVPAVDGIGNQQVVRRLLQYWTTVKADDSRLRLSSVHTEWRARNPPRSSTNYAIPNMKDSRNRVAFARYMVTGEFPLLSKDGTSRSELIGNVCMFAGSDKCTSKANGETVLGALPLETILTIHFHSFISNLFPSACWRHYWEYPAVTVAKYDKCQH